MATTQTASKRHFEFQVLKTDAKPVLKWGWEDDVRDLQSFLTEGRDLRRGRVPGCLCDWTSAALRHFQKCCGLLDTGEADEETLRMMTRPRCGMSDIGPEFDRSSGPAPFVLRGCKYVPMNLKYALLNRTPDLATGRDRDIVRQAFTAGAAVSPRQYIEVAPTEAPTFSIAWARLNHGDGSSFDDEGSIQGNVRAHAFIPHPCGGPFAGALHFDEFERWVAIVEDRFRGAGLSPRPTKRSACRSPVARSSSWWTHGKAEGVMKPRSSWNDRE
jgi:hypothetical protein